MKIFKVIKYAFLTLIILISVILLFLNSPPKFITSYIKKNIELITLKSTGLYLTIEDISKLSINLFKQEIKIDNLTLYPDKTKNLGYFLKFKTLNINFDALGFLLGNKNTHLKISMNNLDINIVLDKNKKLKFYPILPPSKQEPKETKLPKLPNTVVDIKNINIIYKDESKLFSTLVNIPYTYLTLDKSKDLFIYLTANLENNKLAFLGNLDIIKGKTNLSLLLNSPNLNKLSNYVLDNLPFNLKLASTKLYLTTSFDDWKLNNIKLYSNLNISSIKIFNQYTLLPIELNPINIALSNTRLKINELKLNFITPILAINGEVLYNLPFIIKLLNLKAKQDTLLKKLLPSIGTNLNLHLDIPNINSILNCISSYTLKNLSIPINKVQGNLSSNLNIKGSILSPKLKGFIKGSNLNYNGLKLDSFNTNLDYVDKKIYIAPLTVKLFNGSINANGYFNLKNKIYCSTAININNLNLGNLLYTLNTNFALKIPFEYIPNLALNSEILCKGEIDNPLIEGKLYSSKITFPVTSKLPPVANTNLNFLYKDKELTIRTLKLYTLSGNIQSKLNLSLKTKMPKFDGSLSITNLSISELINNLKLQIPAEYKPHLNLNTTIAFSGTPVNPVIQGSISTSKITFLNNSKLPSISDTNLKLFYKNKNGALTFKSKVNKGEVLLYATLLNNDYLKGKGLFKNVPLNLLNNWINDLNIKSGNLELITNFNGSIKKIAKDISNLSADASLLIKDIDFNYRIKNEKTTSNKIDNQDKANFKYAYKSVAGYTMNNTSNLEDTPKLKNSQTIDITQSIDKIAINLNFKHGIINILSNTGLTVKNSNLNLFGKIFPLNIKTNNKNIVIKDNLGEIFLKAQNIDLKDFPFLKEFNISNGNIYIDAYANYKNNNLAGNLLTKIDNFESDKLVINKGIVDLDIQDKKIKLKNVNITQSNEQINLKGNIDISKDPILNLNLIVNNFDIKTLFSFIPQEYFKKVEEETKNINAQPLDSQPVIYSLPQENQIKSFIIDTPFEQNKIVEQLKNIDLEKISPNNLSIPLAENIEHWQRNKLTPLTLEEKIILEPIPPFWEMIKGKFSTNITLKGKLTNPEVNIIASLTQGEIYRQNINEIALNAKITNKILNINKFYLIENNGGYLDLLGTIDIDKQNILAQSNGKLNLNWANKWLKPFNIVLEGQTKFLSSIDGSISKPHILFSTDINSGYMNEMYFDYLSTFLEFINGNLNITYGSLGANGNEVIFNGFIPVQEKNKSMDINLKLQDENFGLISVFSKDLEWLGGSGNALIKISGTPEQPQLDGKVRIRDGKIYLNNLKELVENINTDILINTNQVDIKNLNALYSKGEANITGTVELLQYLPSFLNLKVKTNKINISKPLFNAIISTDLSIKNEITNPSIGGTVNLEKGEVNIQLDSIKAKQVSTSGTTSIRFGGLKVNIDKDFWIRSPIFDLQTYGSIKLTGPQERMRIEGKLEIKKGSKLFLLNNQFKIQSGIIEFGKSAKFKQQILEGEINPYFDIIAEVLINHPKKTDSIIAKIQGTLEDMLNNKLTFEWLQKGGLTETEILTTLSGAGLVDTTVQGGITKVLESFKDFFARGFIEPLTWSVTEALGLDDLSLGITDDQNIKFALKTKSLYGFSGNFESNFDNKGTLKYIINLNYKPNSLWTIKYTYDAKKTYAHEIKAEVSYSLDELLKSFNIDLN